MAKSATLGISDLTRRDLVFAEVEGREHSGVLRSLAGLIVERVAVPSENRLFEALWEREELQSTGIGEGVAIPHCKVRGLKKVLLAVATCKDEVDFDAPDKKPVRLLFVILSPTQEPAAHLQALSAVSHWLRDHPEVARTLPDLGEDSIYESLTGANST